MAAQRLGIVQRMTIRRCVGSKRLACGCTVGVYETFGGRTLAVIDGPAAACGRPEHAEGMLAPASPPQSIPARPFRAV